MEIVTCPDHRCLAPAEVLDRWDFSSTDGPVEHVKTLCLSRHTFTVPTTWVTDTRAPAVIGITKSAAASFDGDWKRSRGMS
jgi:hypothetical protein